MLDFLEKPGVVIVLLVALVVFGSKRLPDSARALGRSMRILKAEAKGLREDDVVVAPPAIAPPATVVAPPATVVAQPAPVVAPPASPAPTSAATAAAFLPESPPVPVSPGPTSAVTPEQAQHPQP